MLNLNFSRLIFFAALIATPISIYFARFWLEGFAYRVEGTAGAYIAAFLITFIIAVLSVSFQSLSAATINPVSTLKEE